MVLKTHEKICLNIHQLALLYVFSQSYLMVYIESGQVHQNNLSLIWWQRVSQKSFLHSRLLNIFYLLNNKLSRGRSCYKFNIIFDLKIISPILIHNHISLFFHFLCEFQFKISSLIYNQILNILNEKSTIFSIFKKDQFAIDLLINENGASNGIWTHIICLEGRDSSQLNYACMVEETRFELVPKESKSFVLPLHYSSFLEVNNHYTYQWNLLEILSNLCIDIFLKIFWFFLLNN